MKIKDANAVGRPICKQTAITRPKIYFFEKLKRSISEIMIKKIEEERKDMAEMMKTTKATMIKITNHNLL